MIQETLEELGLSPNEAKIYETLLERGELAVGDISVHAKIHRRNTYDAIYRLLEKGLCFEVHGQNEKMYSPVDPGKLKEILAEKQRKLDLLIPDLEKKYRSKASAEEVYIYKGLEGQKNIWRDVLREGKDSYVVGAKGCWFDPALTIARNEFFREANRRKLKFIQLFEDGIIKKFPEFPKQFQGRLEYRVLPKEQSTNSMLHIFGDYIVTYTNMEMLKTPDDVVYFITHSQSMAESYRKWFRFMWDHCPAGKKQR